MFDGWRDRLCGYRDLDCCKLLLITNIFNIYCIYLHSTFGSPYQLLIHHWYSFQIANFAQKQNGLLIGSGSTAIDIVHDDSLIILHQTYLLMMSCSV